MGEESSVPYFAMESSGGCTLAEVLETIGPARVASLTGRDVRSSRIRERRSERARPTLTRGRADGREDVMRATTTDERFAERLEANAEVIEQRFRAADELHRRLRTNRIRLEVSTRSAALHRRNTFDETSVSAESVRFFFP